MTCTYCNTDHGQFTQCDIQDLRDNIDQLSELIEDQAAIICNQTKQLESKNVH